MIIFLAFVRRSFEGDKYLGLSRSFEGAQAMCQEQADQSRLKGERKQLRWWEPIEGMDRIWTGSRTSAAWYDQWKVLEEVVPDA